MNIDGKTFDVDALKDKYVKMSGGKIDGEEYDSSNSAHVSKVHAEVDSKGWDKKQKSTIKRSADRRHLPNLIYDITGKDPDKKVTAIAKEAKELGYKVALIWVMTNRSEAILRNLGRSRHVKDEIFHSIHNKLREQMLPFLKSQAATDTLDEAWVVYSSHTDITQPGPVGDMARHTVVELAKNDSGFALKGSETAQIEKYLGPIEVNPSSPKTYLSQDEVIKKFNPPTKADGKSYDFSEVRKTLKPGANLLRENNK